MRMGSKYFKGSEYYCSIWTGGPNTTGGPGIYSVTGPTWGPDRAAGRDYYKCGEMPAQHKILTKSCQVSVYLFVDVFTILVSLCGWFCALQIGNTLLGIFFVSLYMPGCIVPMACHIVWTCSFCALCWGLLNLFACIHYSQPELNH